VFGAGRDKGVFMVVVGFSGDRTYISRRKLRRAQKPKLKKLKHVKPTNEVAGEIAALLEEKKMIDDASLKKALISYESKIG
jgi:ribosomal protein L14E/L6E/L27E